MSNSIPFDGQENFVPLDGNHVGIVTNIMCWVRALSPQEIRSIYLDGEKIAEMRIEQ